MRRAAFVCSLLFSISASAQNTISVPAFSSTLTLAATRGFFFQAPGGFNILGLRVYNEANLPAQVVEVIDFGATPPPPFPAGVGGTQLFYDNATPAGTLIAANVQCVPGNYYGILGACNPSQGSGITTSSMGSSPHASSILGTPVQLVGLGTQSGIAASGGNQPCFESLSGQMGRIEVHVGAAGGFAQTVHFGAGCYDSPRMVWQQFPGNSPAIDVANRSYRFSYTPNASTGGQYVIADETATLAYDGATAAANGVDLLSMNPTSTSSGNWDDASIVRTLPASFGAGLPFPGPAPGGATTDITVNSNAKVFLGNTTDGSVLTNGPTFGSSAAFQGSVGVGLPTVAPFYNDLDPTMGGHLWYEDPSPNGGVRLTWADIPNWDLGIGTPVYTVQIQLELLPSGDLTLAFGVLGNGGSPANAAILGFSAGNGEPLAPQIDWDQAITPSMLYVSGYGAVPLSHDADARPVLGTTIQLTIANIPLNSPIAGLLHGLVEHNPGIDLGPAGMPGCYQYTSFDSVLLLIAPGVMASAPLSIPNDPGLVGVEIKTQAAAYNPAAIPNVLGAVSSNGVAHVIDVY